MPHKSKVWLAACCGKQSNWANTACAAQLAKNLWEDRQSVLAFCSNVTGSFHVHCIVEALKLGRFIILKKGFINDQDAAVLEMHTVMAFLMTKKQQHRGGGDFDIVDR